MKRRYIEDGELISYMEWASFHHILKHVTAHIENERKTTEFGGIIRKKKGVKKGVSDILVAYPVACYHGLWIELKGPKNMKGYKPAIVTPEQKCWLARMNSLGYVGRVCYGFDEAKKLTENYLELDVSSLKHREEY